MAVTAKMYAESVLNMGGGDTAGYSAMDLLSDTLKVGLLDATGAAAIDQAADDLWADISGNEISGTGYTTGGATLGSKTYATASLVTTFDAADTAWTTASFSADAAVIYDDTLSTSGQIDALISYVDFGATNTVSSGTFTITWNASGIFTITVA